MERGERMDQEYHFLLTFGFLDTLPSFLLLHKSENILWAREAYHKGLQEGSASETMGDKLPLFPPDSLLLT
jgi:hypothetical protein